MTPQIRLCLFGGAAAIALTLLASVARADDNTCPLGFEPVYGDGLIEDANGNGIVCLKFRPGRNGRKHESNEDIVIVDDHGNE